MRHHDLMKDPFYASILFAIESNIDELERLAAAQGILLTDSNVRSLLVKAIHAANGKPPKSIQGPVGAKEKFVAGKLLELIAVKESLAEQNGFPDGSIKKNPISQADWIKSLEAVKESCAIRTADEPGSRNYLEFLRDFIRRAKG